MRPAPEKLRKMVPPGGGAGRPTAVELSNTISEKRIDTIRNLSQGPLKIILVNFLVVT